MKGFKPTGNGPKSGHSFSGKKGFSGSTGRVQQVRGYTRSKPKFATGGAVGSSVVRRTQPVTQFDAEHGGKSPLRPGFNQGGPACYGFGGKVANVARQVVGRAAPASLSTPVKAPNRGNTGPIKAGSVARQVGGQLINSAKVPSRGNAGPVKAPGRPAHHGYGSFGRRPVVG